MKAAVLLALLFALGLHAFNPASYSNNQVLRDTPLFKAHWSIVSDEIHLALEVETTGWIGFGIAEPTSGSMPGADVLIAWVDDVTGVAYVSDRHTIAKEEPIVDDCQSWNLVAGEQTATSTIIEVTRKLNTGDSQDREIRGGTSKIIWSHGDTDEFGYHGANRKADGFLFFGNPPPVAPTGSTITTFTYLTPDYLIPAVETTYTEFDVILPTEIYATPHHLVRFEHVLNPATAQFVHHFVVDGCKSPNATDCTMIWAWAPGIDPLNTPAEAGFRFGSDASNYKSFLLHVHYNNPGSISGARDASGIKFYFDTTMRQFDAAVLQLGDALVSQPNVIPQGNGIIEYEYSCPAGCTVNIPQPITIFGDFQHMHQVGDMIWSTHWRGDTFLGEVSRIEYWDFAFQQTVGINVQLQPGDRVNTHCVYKNTPNRAVPFGQASDDEMCIEYIFYYPAIDGAPACSYGYIPGLNRNGTLCGVVPMLKDNPEVRDPVGGLIRRFPTAPAASYTCPVVTISSDGGQASSTTDSSTTTTGSPNTTTGQAASTTTAAGSTGQAVESTSGASALIASIAMLIVAFVTL